MVSARKGRLQFVSSLLPGQTSPLWEKKKPFWTCFAWAACFICANNVLTTWVLKTWRVEGLYNCAYIQCCLRRHQTKKPLWHIHWRFLLDTGPVGSRANSPSLNKEPGQTFHGRNFIHWTLGWGSFCTHPFKIATNPKVLKLKLCFGHQDVSDAWIPLKLSLGWGCS